MTTTHAPDLPGVLTAENLLVSADMSTYWNTQSYPNPRGRFVIIQTPNGSRIIDCRTEEEAR